MLINICFVAYHCRGSIMPYALSWMLYQGSLLMSVLNWTGLIVNGFVAFLLPMVLALKSTELRSHRRRARGINMLMHDKPDIMITRETHRFGTSTDDVIHEEDGIELAVNSESQKNYNSTHHEENRQQSDIPHFTTSQRGETHHEDRRNLLQARISNTRVMASSSVEPLPIELEIYRREIVLFMILAFATIIMMTIMEDALQGIAPASSSEET